VIGVQKSRFFYGLERLKERRKSIKNEPYFKACNYCPNGESL